MFFLNCPEGPPELRESYGFKLSEVSRIEKALVAVLDTLCEEWRFIHARY